MYLFMSRYDDEPTMTVINDRYKAVEYATELTEAGYTFLDNENFPAFFEEFRERTAYLVVGEFVIPEVVEVVKTVTLP